jgi:hypothetical protein
VVVQVLPINLLLVVVVQGRAVAVVQPLGQVVLLIKVEMVAQVVLFMPHLTLTLQVAVVLLQLVRMV